MSDELHLWIDFVGMGSRRICTTLYQTNKDIYILKRKRIDTTIPTFLSWEYSKKLFVHIDGEVHEIKLGDTEGTEREIKLGHNLCKMLLAGEFDWYR